MKTKLINASSIIGMLVVLFTSAVWANDESAEITALTEAVKKDLQDINAYSPFANFHKLYPASKNTWEYLEAQTEKRLDDWKKAAEAGIPEGQVLFALHYMRPSNARLEENREEMAREMRNWFRKAAEQGNADGQFWHGQLSGRAERVDWLRKAAEQGHARAQYELGNAIQWSADRDVVEMAKWYRKAAEQGLVEAQWSAGMSYRGWGGIPYDPVEAAKWYRKAAEQGLPQAMQGLGRFYLEGKGVPQNSAQAVEWFYKSIENGDPGGWAAHYLGECYLKGNGVPKDTEKAVGLFRTAATQNFAASYYKLAWCYTTGTGVSKDTEEAKRWLREAERKYSFRSLSWRYVDDAATLLKNLEAGVELDADGNAVQPAPRNVPLPLRLRILAGLLELSGIEVDVVWR